MRVFQSLLLIAMIALWPQVQTARAGSISDLIDKLDKLEARMAQLESAQQAEMHQLKQELGHAQVGATDTHNGQTVWAMSGKIEAMNEELNQVKAGSDQLKLEYAELLAELKALTMELYGTSEVHQSTLKMAEQPSPLKTSAAESQAPAIASVEPSLSYKFYGYVKLDGSYDQNPTSHGNFVMWVKPRDYSGDDEQFNMTANQSRLGFRINSKNYDPYTLTGQFEVDLYGSVSGGIIAENKGMFMLRHAYFAIQKGSTKLLAGQTWDLLGPLNPPTLNYPVLWGVGNVGYRRAQVSLFQSFKVSSETEATLAGGVFRNIGSDLTPTLSWSLADSNETSDGQDDGTDAGIPTTQGRLDINHTLASGAKLNFGVSGLWGQLKAETNHGNYNTYESRGICGYLKLDFKSGAGIAGEYYQGSNMGSYFGAILDNSSIDGVHSHGGWAAAWFRLSPKTKAAFGGGIDRVDEADIADGTRQKNQTYFGNITYEIVKHASVGVEVSKWQTDYKAGDTMKDLRTQTSFILSF